MQDPPGAAQPGGCHMARWSSRQRERLVITTEPGQAVACYPVPQATPRPGPELLWDTGWLAFPGAEWEEEPPGRWSIPVFTFASPGRP